MSFVPGSFAPGRAWGTERKYDSVAAIRCDSYAPNPFPSNTQTIHDKFPGEDAHNEKYVNNQGGTNPANPGSTDPVPTTSVITPGPSATSQPGFGSGTSWKDNLVRYAMILGIPLIVMAVIVIADCFLSKVGLLQIPDLSSGVLPRNTSCGTGEFCRARLRACWASSLRHGFTPALGISWQIPPRGRVLVFFCSCDQKLNFSPW